MSLETATQELYTVCQKIAVVQDIERKEKCYAALAALKRELSSKEKKCTYRGFQILRKIKDTYLPISGEKEIEFSNAYKRVRNQFIASAISNERFYDHFNSEKGFKRLIDELEPPESDY